MTGPLMHDQHHIEPEIDSSPGLCLTNCTYPTSELAVSTVGSRTHRHRDVLPVAVGNE
jgi:hypothetical protein